MNTASVQRPRHKARGAIRFVTRLPIDPSGRNVVATTIIGTGRLCRFTPGIRPDPHMRTLRFSLLATLAVLCLWSPTSTAQAPAAAPDPNAPGIRELTALQDFTIVSTKAGYVQSADFVKFLGDAQAGVKERGLFEGRGPLAILAIVFVGGLALNLTPCVLPMIPINLAIIGAGAQAGSRRRG